MAWLAVAFVAVLPAPASATAGFCADLRLMILSVRDTPTFSSVTRSSPPPDLALFRSCSADRHDFTSAVTCEWHLPSAAPAVADLAAEAIRCLPGARRRNKSLRTSAGRGRAGFRISGDHHCPGPDRIRRDRRRRPDHRRHIGGIDEPWKDDPPSRRRDRGRARRGRGERRARLLGSRRLVLPAQGQSPGRRRSRAVASRWPSAARRSRSATPSARVLCSPSRGSSRHGRPAARSRYATSMAASPTRSRRQFCNIRRAAGCSCTADRP